jgi:hypothetical protein
VQDILSRDGLPVEVVNAAVPGHNTADSLGKMYCDVWLLDPDIVVLCEAWNDTKYFTDLSAQRPYSAIVRPHSGRDWRMQPAGIDSVLCMSSLYRIARAGFVSSMVGDEGAGDREVAGRVGEDGVRQYELNVATLADLGHNLGATVVLCKQARLPTAENGELASCQEAQRITGLPQSELVKAFDQCDRSIERVAEDKGCPVIDSSALMTGRPEYFLDHVHLTPDGSKRAAQIVADGLRPIVSSRAASCAE